VRVLVYDIETSPNLGYVWGKWDQNVLQFEHEWEILCFAYKWLGEREVHAVSREGQPDDRQVVTQLRNLFDEADVTVTHNGKAFDKKKANTRLIVHGLTPPSPYREVDTLQVARRQFAFNSNKLDDLCRMLGLPRKKQTGGFKTWLGCMADDPKAWERMVRYNKADVVILERLYLRMRPWVVNHPNLNLDRPEACPRCGHGVLIARGWKTAAVTRRRSFQCKKCGGYSAGRTVDYPKLEYRSL
jgi:ribosomal protein S27AE